MRRIRERDLTPGAYVISRSPRYVPDFRPLQVVGVRISESADGSESRSYVLHDSGPSPPRVLSLAQIAVTYYRLSRAEVAELLLLLPDTGYEGLLRWHVARRPR